MNKHKRHEIFLKQIFFNERRIIWIYSAICKISHHAGNNNKNIYFHSHSCNTNKGISRRWCAERKIDRLKIYFISTWNFLRSANPELRRKLFDFLLIIEMSLFIDSISFEREKYFFLLNAMRTWALAIREYCSQQKNSILPRTPFAIYDFFSRISNLWWNWRWSIGKL